MFNNNLNVREKTEEIEKIILSGEARLSSDTFGRDVFEPLCDLRTEFQRDRDRIVHSKAFRRLKHKTQVFILPRGDHYRTRLIHTLEVSQIARTVARSLRLNEDLTEAIALGHDLGHTPFGHAGEFVLNKISPNGFNHFEQSVRVVEYIEKNGAGLNLTKETRNGMFCHCNLWADTMEGRIVRICDKITYINHDIDDAVRARKLNKRDIPVSFSENIGIHYSQRISTMVRSLIKQSANEDIPCMEPEIQMAFEETRDFMEKNIYNEDNLKFEESKVCVILEMLYSFFVKNINKMPLDIQKTAQTQGVDRAVTDYLAGMTDNFAINVYKDIFIPKSFSFHEYEIF
ncbi:MAG: deoxyguanosinetriphosphate triphosphohydrolase [Oscillospiraceae bacterium]|jgi:dGTPase|nr:deoxyguanosinetriphosphate triphosphohydrolase [Oscillospiraceae bacterium]